MVRAARLLTSFRRDVADLRIAPASPPMRALGRVVQEDHVNVFLYDGGIVPDPEGIITEGHTNKTARTVAIREGQAIKARVLTSIFKQIIANNRAGGWRRLKNEDRGA